MEIVKTFLKYKSGSGVYIVKFEHRFKTHMKIIHKVQVVYCDGFKSDWPINYENGLYGYDIEHSKTKKRAVERAFKYMYNNLLHIVRVEPLKNNEETL